MSKQTVPVIYQHADHPEWGRGVVVPREQRQADRLDLSFESGGKRIILKSFASKLVPVAMSDEDAVLLGDRLTSRRTVSGPIKIGQKKKNAAVPATLASFAAQVQLFEATFAGGFRGEAFERDERGLTEGKRKKTSKQAAIADAARLLGKEAFETLSEAQLFENAVELVKTTSFVHPLEGANALVTMKPENRTKFVAALRDWLHGTDKDEAGRFDGFVASIKLDEGSGSKRASWPLATVFAALVHPTKHVCVKPTFFQKQAALVGVPVDYQPAPSSAVYGQFREVTRATEAKLREAGHDPRDLVDVWSFVCVTQGAKAAPVKA